MNLKTNKNKQARNYYYDRIPLSQDTIYSDPEERRYLSYFAYATFSLIEDHKVDANDFFIPFPSEQGELMFRENYYKFKRNAVESGILIEKEYGINEHGESITYSEQAGLCKAYKLRDDLIWELRQNKFSKKVISSPRHYPRNMNTRTQSIIIKNEHELTLEEREIVDKLAKNYMEYEITVDPAWQDQYSEIHEENNLYEYYNVLHVVKKIERGIFNISIGENNGRVYHPLITMPKKYRKYILFNGKPLWNIDMSCFHPLLLATFIEDEDKKSKYVSFLKDNDIYYVFIDDLDVIGHLKPYEDMDTPEDWQKAVKRARNSIKIDFQRFLGSTRCFDTKTRQIRDWYKKNFPEIIRKKTKIIKSGSNCQLELQKIESEIFVNNVFRKADFWMGPAHDGDFVIQDDIFKAEQLIKQELENFLKFDVSLKIEPV